MPSVLIIEDDADSRRAIGKLFERADWKVLEAADGDAGVEVAIRNQPEVILCDLLMPKSNGFQVCRTIRQQLQPTKIIVVSGRDYAVDRASALEAGADEYLLKPITWEVLCDVIDRLPPTIPRRPGATKLSEKLGSVPPRLKFWGVRGSLPVPGAATVRYGGNTSCVEVRADGEIIVLDAGTGIRGLGLALEKELGPQMINLTLLITHTGEGGIRTLGSLLGYGALAKRCFQPLSHLTKLKLRPCEPVGTRHRRIATDASREYREELPIASADGIASRYPNE